MDYTFHSVILAGGYDLKNLKLKIRPEAEKIHGLTRDNMDKYNSPWNIAADFKVDMTFHPEEIAQMLTDYEDNTHTGMDIKAVSEEIYMENYPELKRFIYAISIHGDTVTYDVNNLVMDFATMFSIIKCDEHRKVRIHNIIFEEVLNNYFIAEQSIADLGKLRFEFNYIHDGQLNMEMVLSRFADLMHEEYRNNLSLLHKLS